MPEVFTAGNTGDKVRSDCRVSLSPEQSGGIRISLQSKVKVLYGKDIERLVLDVLKHFGIEHASVSVEDSGALSFVIAARTEAAARKMLNSDPSYLLPAHRRKQVCIFTRQVQVHPPLSSWQYSFTDAECRPSQTRRDHPGP